MQLTIKATGADVKVVSFLLAKNPYNIYERDCNGHLVRMFYSKFEEEEVEATIFVAPDPIQLSRTNSNTYDITSYINDREFAVSSIFCTFIKSALGTALNGMPKEEYASWVNYPFNFQFSFGPLSSKLPDKQILDLFQPLGYEVDMIWGDINYSIDIKSKSTARYITLKGLTTLQNGLRQLMILIPVLDNYKHYYIDNKEIEKITKYGKGWLEAHPQKEWILRKALRFKDVYKLIENEDKDKLAPEKGRKAEVKKRLNDLRYEKISQLVNSFENKETVVDYGSGEGKLSLRLASVKGIREIYAVEPSQSAMRKALKRLEKAAVKNTSIMPVIGSLFYYDERLSQKDVMILCEVIEHIDAYRLPKVMKMILEQYRPKVLIITTPNKEYNQACEMSEEFRHPDHRFEWTRKEFYHWCKEQSITSPYDLTFDGVGEEHTMYGYPTQMCLFTRKEG